MGADGGTIPKRCELVKKRTKKEKVERDVQNASKWQMCQLSQQPLRVPIVACRLGRLYNKEAVLEALVTKTTKQSENAKHIHHMRDVRELRLTANPEFRDRADKGDVYKDPNMVPFVCPITGLEMNGNQRFVVNWQCGCVISEKAIKEVESDVCHSCGTAIDPETRVVLNPTDEERQCYLIKLEAERVAKKGLRQESVASSSKTVVSSSKSVVSADRKRKAEDEESSLQKDPTKSNAYKGLFTTCEEAKRKPQQHWVTHNPLFY